ncbi:MAG: hypothetical protein COV74_10415 [Candidatus Omnitrophica bacterium CG11_big_fil_rev_8_21_14_0_20_45_26]|uniref:Secreted protein n=1 Tax=Candidatus Abzuiibacterium crystallinum TaxID=1974748 RepID=A0A2H0LMV5_9BACT|nr:MAG: hypothetical protein COV74_10415 [Candidatus Omnitrophica bacterium CG11_big_fil_rev_8_21_14_0_20_45_26]PIW63919.1 MAG: hypothetical protein COW12_08405 [Candidatus Omnitrophica bacterium CG12_big_fil_rev_8_21_14_0_65_45_16]
MRIKKKVFWIVFLTGVLGTASFSAFASSDYDWEGFFYPQGDTLNTQIGGPFKSSEDCLRWVKSQAKTSKDTYECGKNCRKNAGFTTCQDIVY